MEQNQMNDGVGADCSSDAENYFNSMPSGYRFAPRDEELIVHYLLRKINNDPLPPNKIREVNLYKFSPQELAGTYKLNRESEWYFFTTREKRYPNGCRPNRGAGKGYWKLTGSDKAIPNKDNPVGFRKTLDYYEGTSQRKATKTNWKMHEYLLNRTSTDKKPLQLDEWVLCKIYNKAESKKRKNDEDAETEIPEAHDSIVQPPASDNSLMISQENNDCIGSYFPHFSGPPPIFNILGYDPPPMNNTFNNLGLDPLPMNNTCNNFVYNLPPIRLYNPSSRDGFQPIHKSGDQFNHTDSMQMATINGNDLVPMGETIPLVGRYAERNSWERDGQPRSSFQPTPLEEVLYHAVSEPSKEEGQKGRNSPLHKLDYFR